MSTPVQGVEQLRAARMKLQRAEEHLGQLVSEHESFIRERNPYRMLPEFDPDPGYDVLWRVKIVDHPPLERWSSLAGECLHAMRSALDYLALALVRVHDHSADYAEFPILKDKFVERGGKQVLRWSVEAPKKLRGVDRKPLAQRGCPVARRT